MSRVDTKQGTTRTQKDGGWATEGAKEAKAGGGKVGSALARKVVLRERAKPLLVPIQLGAAS